MFACSFAGSPSFFLDIAGCFSTSKSKFAKSPSEESIFFILAKGMH